MQRVSYSYRDDPRVPLFDDSKPLIIFDGLCVLCSTGVQWMMARDPDGSSRFAAIQTDIPRALYAHYNLDADSFETFMVLADGVAHTRWRGLLAAGKTLPQPWRVLAIIGRIVPDFIGNPIYDVVQRKRIGWFGARAACFVPDIRQRARFMQV
jgi:predicted DCC family thiol-disulfide oxidoreductase YuxK